MKDGIDLVVLNPGEPVLIEGNNLLEFRPVKLYILPNGALDDTPSFVFEGVRPDTPVKCFMQISDNMLRDVLEEALKLRKY